MSSAFRFAALFWTMVRPGVAVRLLGPFMLGLSVHGGFWTHPLGQLLTLAALAAGYAVATSCNDLNDQDVDTINARRLSGRPLVAGSAAPAELRRVVTVGAVGALLLGAAAGVGPLAVVAGFLVIAFIYSVPPFRLARRRLIPYPVLGLAHGATPFVAAVAVLGVRLGWRDLVTAGGLTLLYSARLLLKDFRDLKGDRLCSKPTFLACHGPVWTTRLSTVIALPAILMVVGGSSAPAWWLGASSVIAGLSAVLLSRLGQTATWSEQAVLIVLIGRLGAALLLGTSAACPIAVGAIPTRVGPALVTPLLTVLGITLWVNWPPSVASRLGQKRAQALTAQSASN